MDTYQFIKETADELTRIQNEMYLRGKIDCLEVIKTIVSGIPSESFTKESFISLLDGILNGVKNGTNI